MNATHAYFKRVHIVPGILLLTAALISSIAGADVQPAQARLLARKTQTPTPTRTPTPTPTSMPYATPTPGPTTTVAGTWKIVSSPNVGTGTFGNQLNAVAVASATDVWSVGFSPDPSGTPLYVRRSLIEHWDGTIWSVVTSPNPAGKPDVELNGVDAMSASDAWAVGHSGDPAFAPLQTLTEHWNGTNWSIISSPSPGTYNGNDLTAVAAIASNDVWAVGWYQSGPTGQEGGALTMHWDGTSWTVVPNPSKANLYAVTAVSSNDVWAVGAQVILHWNGTSWRSVSFPLPACTDTPFAVLKGISAGSATDIWTVGYNQCSYFSGYIDNPLTYHWNGSNWSLVPNAGNTPYLFGVTVIAANDVWAVGDNGQEQHWNGATWRSVAAPYPDNGGRFNAVDATSASDVWAVGKYSQAVTNQWRTWIDRYTIP